LKYKCRRCHRNPVSHPRHFCPGCAKYCIKCHIRERQPGQGVCGQCRAETYAKDGAISGRKRYELRRQSQDFVDKHRMRTQVNDYYRIREEERPSRCEFCGSDMKVQRVFTGLDHGLAFWNLWLCSDHRSKINALLGRNEKPSTNWSAASKSGGKRSSKRKISPKNRGEQARQAEGKG